MLHHVFIAVMPVRLLCKVKLLTRKQTLLFVTPSMVACFCAVFNLLQSFVMIVCAVTSAMVCDAIFSVVLSSRKES